MNNFISCQEAHSEKKRFAETIKEASQLTAQAILVILSLPIILLHWSLSPLLYLLARRIPRMGLYYLDLWKKDFMQDIILSNPLVHDWLVQDIELHNRNLHQQIKVGYVRMKPYIFRLDMIGADAVMKMTPEEVKWLMLENEALTSNSDFSTRLLQVAKDMQSLTTSPMDKRVFRLSAETLHNIIKVAKSKNMNKEFNEFAIRILSLEPRGLSSEDQCYIVENVKPNIYTKVLLKKILRLYDVEVLKILPETNCGDLMFEVLKDTPSEKQIVRLIEAYVKSPKTKDYVQFVKTKYVSSEKVFKKYSLVLDN